MSKTRQALFNLAMQGNVEVVQHNERKSFVKNLLLIIIKKI